MFVSSQRCADRPPFLRLQLERNVRLLAGLERHLLGAALDGETVAHHGDLVRAGQQPSRRTACSCPPKRRPRRSPPSHRSWSRSRSWWRRREIVRGGSFVAPAAARPHRPALLAERGVRDLDGVRTGFRARTPANGFSSPCFSAVHGERGGNRLTWITSVPIPAVALAASGSRGGRLRRSVRVAAVVARSGRSPTSSGAFVVAFVVAAVVAGGFDAVFVVAAWSPGVFRRSVVAAVVGVVVALSAGFSAGVSTLRAARRPASRALRPRASRARPNVRRPSRA